MQRNPVISKPAILLAPLALAASGCASLAYDGTSPDAIECAAVGKYTSTMAALQGRAVSPDDVSERLYAYYSAKAEQFLADGEGSVAERITERAVAINDAARAADDSQPVLAAASPCIEHMMRVGEL